jgi:hypothetical protein
VLMAQGEHLEMKRGPRLHDSSEGLQKRDQDGHHREGSVPLGARNCNGASMYAVFSRHRLLTLPLIMSPSNDAACYPRGSRRYCQSAANPLQYCRPLPEPCAARVSTRDVRRTYQRQVTLKRSGPSPLAELRRVANLL